MTDNQKDEETARKAYQIWEEEGRPEGRDKEHWQQAQEALKSPGKPARKKAAPKKAAPKKAAPKKAAPKKGAPKK